MAASLCPTVGALKEFRKLALPSGSNNDHQRVMAMGLPPVCPKRFSLEEFQDPLERWNVPREAVVQ